MFVPFNDVEFKIPFRKIKESHVWQLSPELPIAQEIASPLFEAGVREFAIAEKQTYTGFPPKPNHCHIFTLVLQGQLTVQIGQRKLIHGPGMLSFCPIDEIFNRYAKGPTWWIYINLQDIPLWEPLKLHGWYERQYEWTSLMLLLTSHIFRISQNQTLRNKLNALDYSRMVAELLKRELLIPCGAQDRNAGILQSLVSTIQHEPCKEWTVAEMARLTRLSRRSLTRHFRDVYGLSPMDVVIRSRIEWAMRKLLYTNEKLDSIASSLNYTNTESFSRVFLKKTGLRPGAFRAKGRAGGSVLP